MFRENNPPKLTNWSIGLGVANVKKAVSIVMTHDIITYEYNKIRVINTVSLCVMTIKRLYISFEFNAAVTMRVARLVEMLDWHHASSRSDTISGVNSIGTKYARMLVKPNSEKIKNAKSICMMIVTTHKVL